MKKLNYLLLCLLATTVLLSVISACSKEEGSKEEQTPIANLTPFLLPENSDVEMVGNTINFSIPSSHTGYGVDLKGNYISFNKGSITCTCKSGEDGGCSPITSSAGNGCLMTTCTNCELTRSSRTSGFDVELEEMVVFDMSIPTKKVKSVEDLKGKIMLPHQFVELDIIQEEIKKIEKEAARYPSERTKIAPVILYGYIVMLEVPEAYGISTISTVFYVCNCTGGSRGFCHKVNHGTYIYCDSRCKSCTMTATLKDEDFDSKEYVMEVSNHRISIL
ncbi:hypothetical protein [Sphingobacterium chuzhouense]|uniref:Uncharacterized protein n=1 Tax=Sphingobacterium chuzhouense TaxID=1742264 RepID=A0ABR7XNV4_9SPHI|nr:hypothetical protein [Sphingobacterium chuzhouense]MBD1420856.1 hypothetical protein [Sphingobacterium chuzhouense]